MSIFRYLASHGLETLRDARLKVAAISSFNDPFECMYQVTGEMTMPKAKEHFRKRMKEADFLAIVRNRDLRLRSDEAARRQVKKNIDRMAGEMVRNFPATKIALLAAKDEIMDRVLRVACFCANEDPLDDILMWSHYAKSHFGIRIGFEFPPNISTPFKIVPILYRGERVKMDASIEADSDEFQVAANLTASTKSNAWKYEDEHRLLTVSKLCVQVVGPGREVLEFMPFDRTWVTRVDFGARFTPTERVPLVRLLKSDYPHVKIYTTNYHRTDFSLVYDPVP